MTYAALTAELEALLHEIEHSPDLPLDELTRKVQRAYTLIGEGRQQLRTTEEAVVRVIESFEALNDDDDADSEANNDNA